MPLVKHDYPVLEYDTASKAVFQPGNGKKCFPAKAVFAFLGDEVENYAHTHDGIQISSNPQPPSKNEIELKEKEATQKKRLKEVKIATRRHKIPLPHNAT